MFKFGAKKAWVPRDAREAEVEEVEEEEVAGGVREMSARSRSARAPASSSSFSSRRVKVEAASTNVVRLELGEQLGVAPAVQTGEVLLCKCGAAFSALSKVENAQNNNDNNNNNNNKGGAAGARWACEFCDAVNEIPLDPAEYPKEASVDYLLEGPKVEQVDNKEAYSLIFVVDTSGSMCCTVPSNAQKLKGGTQASEEVKAFREGGADQWLPREDRNVRYVSRLQCVQAAVESQIEAIRKKSPEVKVGLVTFGSEVTIYGDASSHPTTIAGDRLNHVEQLRTAGREASTLKAIGEHGVAEGLTKTLFKLEESGTTALGPALVVALGMLSGEAAGSKIVLCTDGLANVGVGSIEDADFDTADAFYQSTAHSAKGAGVRIQVISIKGSQCKMELIGALADITGGDVEIVDPLELSKLFGNILAEPVIATNVRLTFRVHSGMMIVEPGHDEKIAVLSKDIGNITLSSNASFEYRVRDAKNLSQRSQLPFQVQVWYQRLDGSKFLRVVSNMQEITDKRSEAEECVNVDVIAANTVQQASNWASMGNYEKARSKMVVQQRLMARHSEPMQSPAAAPEAQGHYEGYLAQAAELDDALADAERSEANAGAQSSASRKAARSDNLASNIIKGKNYSPKPPSSAKK